ncbi:ATP-dependent RNA helicase DbpA [Thalassotalea ponticola]|uniref:ATP-dependent RNA helicase DbpA n=1 Tax=Thalassotalea ponticola TaxID=1523392 RepID=UPI0025B3F1B6|nr:ATP-dependent RNA helicase DbpA [Thalassotalea ponticola]MDN3653025.1 ATP-dependent RNA helicase DbpA [Thalassotalea ponticola]
MATAEKSGQADFSSLNLESALVENLASLGYHTMTRIQAQSLPLMLEGKDVIGQAQTGSGKTCAFALALLHNLNVRRFRVQSLVLCPTRELADQVAIEIRKLARNIHNIKVLTLCGGQPMGPQIGSLEHGAHIVVGTPGRVEVHLKKGRLSLDNVNTLVLDEADRMLEIGFEQSLNTIVDYCAKVRQNLLFSATFPEKIERFAAHIMTGAQRVTVDANRDHDKIDQYFYQVDNEQQRIDASKRLLMHFQPHSAVIFCNTKAQCQTLADRLRDSGFDSAALHGDLEQKDRDKTLIQFANKSLTVLVATDVAARGIDVDDVDLVINFHLAHDPQVHLHRIGRTGRAGKQGVACSLISHKEAHKVIRLEDYQGQAIDTVELPSESTLPNKPVPATMVTLQIDGGKKSKLRPGDILGALTANAKIRGEQIGKIKVQATMAFVAVDTAIANLALKTISEGKMKGRNFRVRKLR